LRKTKNCIKRASVRKHDECKGGENAAKTCFRSGSWNLLLVLWYSIWSDV